MKFYLNNIEVFIEMSPNVVETLDNTNDNLTVNLKANTVSEPYAPMSVFQIREGSDILSDWRVVSDEVNIFSLKPLMYKHKVNLVQNIRLFYKYLLRNTVFNQPYQEEAVVSYGRLTVGKQDVFSFTPSPDHQGYFPPYSKTYKIDSKTKIKSNLGYIRRIKRVYESGVNPVETNQRTLDATIYRDGVSVLVLDTTWQAQHTYLNGKYYLKSSDIAILSVAGTYSISFTTPFSSTMSSEIQEGKSFTEYIELYFNVYYYSMYDVIDTLRKQQALNSDTQTNAYLFTMPSYTQNPTTETQIKDNELYTLLKNTVAPSSLTFTQCTMFQALQEAFKMFDAMFTLRPHGLTPPVIGIEYFNDAQSEITPSMTGKTKTIKEDNYNNGLVSYYQNALLDKKFPSNGSTALARSNGIGVPEKNSWYLLTDFPIERVNHLNILITFYIPYLAYNSSTQPELVRYRTKTFTFPSEISIDAADYVFDESLWSLLGEDEPEVAYDSTATKYQQNTIHFKKGDYGISISDYTKLYLQGKYTFNAMMYCAVCKYLGIGNAGAVNSAYPYPDCQLSEFPVLDISSLAPNWHTIRFSCDYQTNANGRLKIESLKNKYGGSILANQSSGAVDIKKLGLNMLGLSLKNGEPTFSSNLKISKWSARVKKGDYFVENGERWVANIINYTLLNDGLIQCSVQWVKDFNELSSRIQIDSVKRLSNISSELTTMSEDNLCQYVYLSSVQNEDYEGIYFTKTDFLNLEAKTFGYSTNYNVDIAYLTPYYEDDTAITGVANRYIPLIKYGSGNAVCFEMSYSSPISAGKQTTYDTSGKWWIFGNNYYFTKDILYTDGNGWADKFTIYLAEYDGTMDTFPIVDTTKTTNRATISKLAYYKKPNEVFALNYELIHLPYSGRENIDFIGSKFIENNGFVSDTNRSFYIVVSSSEKYNVLDTKGLNEESKLITNITITSGSKPYLTFTFGTLTTSNIVSWGIVDENNDLYFSSNDTTNLTSTSVLLYITTKKKRIL